MFGCVCYVHIPKYKQDKLQTMAIKCVFIGYSNTQKGNKCYSPKSKRILVSKDVTFHEGKNYYQENNSDNNSIENKGEHSPQVVEIHHNNTK